MALVWLVTAPLGPRLAASGSTPLAARAAAAPSLNGVWQFDATETREDQRNWQLARPIERSPLQQWVTAGLPTAETAGLGPPPQGRQARSALGARDVHDILRDLLEVVERFTIQVGAGDVAMTDDLGHELTFTTNGKREKHLLAATEFDAKAEWSGASLSIGIEVGDGFQMAETFLPCEDHETMLLVIHVERPRTSPAIKDITRAYMRVH